MNEIIIDRLNSLKSEMRRRSIDFYMIPTSDSHNSEYVGDYFKVREYFSGFTGSNGTLIVSNDHVGLWTDGRYFIQAKNELTGTGITLYKMGEPGVPTLSEYLRTNLKQNQTLGFDGKVFTERYIEGIQKECASQNINFSYEDDLAFSIWNDRPKRSYKKVLILPLKYNGQSFQDKLSQIRNKMKEFSAHSYLLSKLDDIMWLYNIRGNDVECNPVALSYAFITDDENYLFLQKEAITDEIVDYARINHIKIKDYNVIFEFLSNFSYQGDTLLDEYETSYCAFQTIKNKNSIIREKNPTVLLKAIKNSTEIENMKQYFLYDSVAVCKFIFWIINNKHKNEIEASEYLDALRSKIEGFQGLSFRTICAYAKNAAMMHYEANKANNTEIDEKGFLLVDSGGQYLGATTDVTRTICMGKLTEKEKKYFTLVAIGMLQLMNSKFIYGCTGRNLDILARQPLWNEGIDYKCGTGHGVGCFLNVHEGPQSIRWKYLREYPETVLEEGMTITDEPGVYLEGEFGIRTENTLLVKKNEATSDGQFMNFETLTFVPIDLEGIDISYMNCQDIERLNQYHNEVYEKIAPFLEQDEKKWLRNATKSV